MTTRSCGSTIITTHLAALAHSLAVFPVTVALALTLASPTPGRAQDRETAGGTAGTAVASKHHHHYKLIDMGTFGGPASIDRNSVGDPVAIPTMSRMKSGDAPWNPDS